MGQRGLNIALTILLGGALFLGFEYYVLDILGEGECDRADCTFLGDLAYGASANIVFVTCVVLAGAIVWTVPRVTRRLRGSVRR
jgi:hypothetical protein